MKRTDVKTSFYLPRTLLRAARVQAATEGLPLRAVLIAALVAYLPADVLPRGFRGPRGEGRAA
jgi:hypothetical protein